VCTPDLLESPAAISSSVCESIRIFLLDDVRASGDEEGTARVADEADMGVVIFSPVVGSYCARCSLAGFFTTPLSFFLPAFLAFFLAAFFSCLAFFSSSASRICSATHESKKKPGFE
jgi:hypothetical protein